MPFECMLSTARSTKLQSQTPFSGVTRYHGTPQRSISAPTEEASAKSVSYCS
jgi:hypothetical protein